MAVVPESGAEMVTTGVDVYWLPLLMMVISVTTPSSRVTNDVATSPFGPVGDAIVTDGVDVYPLPPFVIVIDSIDL